MLYWLDIVAVAVLSFEPIVQGSQIWTNVWSGFAEGVHEGQPPWYPPFHVYEECSKYLGHFQNASSAFTSCAVQYSIPPTVCTSCTDQYMTMREAYANLTCADGVEDCAHNCSDIVKHNYMVSYVQVIYDDLTANIWNASFCSSCIDIARDPANPASEVARETNSSLEFQKELLDLRMCIIGVWRNNATDHNNKTAEVCDKCSPKYASVYDYFLDSYIKKERQFCLDIEATLNDTVYLWRTIYRCLKPIRPNRSHDAFGIAILVSITALCIASFYTAAYVVTTRKNMEIVHTQFENTAESSTAQHIADGAVLNTLETPHQGLATDIT